MKPFQANLMNAAALILLGLWEHFDASPEPHPKLMTVGFGLIFLLATPPFKQQNKIVAFIIGLLTSLLVIALFLSLLKIGEQPSSSLQVIRTAIMISTSVFFLFTCFRSRQMSGL